MTSLTGKVAIVTGGSRGIGAAIAKRLAADGAKVVVNYHRNADAAAAVVAQIEAASGEALAVSVDMGDLTQISTLFDRTLEQFGHLDILVNNAGVADFRLLDAIDAACYTQTFDVNVRGPLFATQRAARHMTFDGRIINISSGVVRDPNPVASVYAASKAALETMTQCHATELGPRGITVNCIAVGLTETDMLRAVMPPEAQRELIARTPLGRLGTPEDIAEVVAFLASDAARWITGEILGVNGGLR